MQPDKLTTQRFIMPFHLLPAATVTPHRPLQNGNSPGINLGQAHWDTQIVSETKLILTETTCASSLQPGSSHLRAPAAQGDGAGLFAARWEPGWGEPRHTGAQCRAMLPPAGPSLPQFPISRSGQQHLALWQSPAHGECSAQPARRGAVGRGPAPLCSHRTAAQNAKQLG